MSYDLINGLFELCASPFLFLHVRRIFIDKELRGASPFACAFFAAWGVWNCFFYPAVGLWFSFFGGIPVVLMNALWLYGMIKYRSK